MKRPATLITAAWALWSTGVLLASPQQDARTPSQGAISSANRGSVPAGEHWLGSIDLPAVVLGAESLAPGTYGVRLTGEHWKDAPPGATAELMRWVELVQDGKVKGRLLATIIPAEAVADVVDGAPPAPGRLHVQRLIGDEEEFVRAWYNFGGDQLLVHLAAAENEVR